MCFGKIARAFLNKPRLVSFQLKSAKLRGERRKRTPPASPHTACCTAEGWTCYHGDGLFAPTSSWALPPTLFIQAFSPFLSFPCLLLGIWLNIQQLKGADGKNNLVARVATPLCHGDTLLWAHCSTGQHFSHTKMSFICWRWWMCQTQTGHRDTGFWIPLMTRALFPWRPKAGAPWRDAGLEQTPCTMFYSWNKCLYVRILSQSLFVVF